MKTISDDTLIWKMKNLPRGFLKSYTFLFLIKKRNPPIKFCQKIMSWSKHLCHEVYKLSPNLTEGNTFSSIKLVSTIKFCFCKRQYHVKSHETCVGMFIHKLHKRRQKPTTALTEKFDHWISHLNTLLARGGWNLNDPIFKSSNARTLPGGGCWSFELIDA